MFQYDNVHNMVKEMNKISIEEIMEDIDIESIKQIIPQIILYLKSLDTRDEIFNKIYCRVLFEANKILDNVS